MITFKHHGNFKNTERFLSRAKLLDIKSILNSYGEKGVRALAFSTPVNTGETANSWDYKVERTNWGWQINWFNTYENKGANIAILIQYGHGTGTGGYVPPTDFVNPAMKPIFDELAKEIWKEVSSL